MCDSHEQDVADSVAQRIIDILEVVQVQKQHGQRTAARLLVGNVAVGAFRQERAVGKVGERVEVGQPLNAVLGLSLLGDVAEQRDGMRDNAIAVSHAAHRQPLRVGGCILAAPPGLALPASALRQLCVDGIGVEVIVGSGDREQTHGLSYRFGFRVPGDPCECPVDAHDGMGRVGNHDGFTALVKHLGGELQLLLGPLAFGDVARQHNEPGLCAGGGGLARRRQLKPGGAQTGQIKHDLPSGGPALGVGFVQHVHHRQCGHRRQYLGHVVPDQHVCGCHEQLSALAVHAAVQAVQVKLEKRVRDGIDGGTQLLLGGLDLRGALRHLVGQTALMRLQLEKQPGEVGHQQRKQQGHRASHGQHARVSPAFDGDQAQRPLSVGQRQGTAHGVGASGWGRGCDRLFFPRVGPDAPQPVVVSPLGQLRQSGGCQHLGQSDGDVGKAPKGTVALCVFQINRLAPHHSQATLHQFHGAGQGQSA